MKKSLIVSYIIIVAMFAFSSVYASTIGDAKWDLHFENIEVVSGSVVADQQPTIIGSSNEEIEYSVSLSAPGEFYEFTVDVANSGNLDAMVSEVNENQLTDLQKKYLSYEVSYLDGTKVSKNDLLKAGTTVRLRIRLEFKTDITEEDLPKENTNILLSLNACYVQADDNAHEPEINKPDNNENDSKEKSQNKSILGIIKNPKTGDMIIAYIIIFALAVVALVIARKKSNNETKK